jgi:hypothetical protein
LVLIGIVRIELICSIESNGFARNSLLNSPSLNVREHNAKKLEKLQQNRMHNTNTQATMTDKVPTEKELHREKMLSVARVDMKRIIKGKEAFDDPNSFSHTINFDCDLSNNKICCALDRENYDRRYYPRRSNSSTSSNNSPKCRVERKYISSPYELKHLEIIENINPEPEENIRRQAYINFIFEDIPHVVKWMERIAIHMKQSEVHPNQDDYDYLSRFELTKTCTSTSSSTEKQEIIERWDEWIEPITIYGRHPYGIIRCAFKEFTERNGILYYNGKQTPIPFNVSKESRDYILLGNYASYEKSLMNQSPQSNQVGAQRYFFDLGTRSFFSSLSWFICGYLQHAIDFTHIYAYEIDLIAPKSYWSLVPARLHPFLHFYNIPVQTEADGKGERYHSSIDEFLLQIIQVDDFVSVKLDIDHPETEIPIIQKIFNSSLLSLIDEFFFELHFRCEFMMNCGWGKLIPSKISDFPLDRGSATNLFLKLRKAGIRAHIWP